jgi:hypothetical protein
MIFLPAQEGIPDRNEINALGRLAPSRAGFDFIGVFGALSNRFQPRFGA